ncbi:hypothetical protein [uncultured Thermomonospora sp.]|uniref:hypothetical protein n=1 Tax=uncultured Thermomonospora sp. TaxID=671175 RepID=UPI00259B238B|nr:hypothetical protein [uncultured Thermomonospora sp.]
MSFDRDFDWQRALIPRVKQILANYLIAEAPFEEDARHNTDLIVLKLDTVRVACRLRRGEYALRYPDEFTLRSSRPSGAQTELAKVLSGWGDYLFYGFAHPDGGALAGWLLGDLKVFRLWHHRLLTRLPAGQAPGTERRNADGSSAFRVYRVSDLPGDFVVARKRPQPAEVA